MRDNSSNEMNMNSSSRKTRSKTKKQDSSTDEVTNRKNSQTSEKRKLSNSLRIETSVSKPISFNSVHHLLSRAMGGNWHMPNSDKVQSMVLVNQLKKLHFTQMYSPFVRRVTYLTWHPTYPHLIVAGSKGGEMILHNTIKNEDHFCSGIGPGGSIVGLKFSPEDAHIVFTAAITGNIRREDFTGKSSRNLASTLTWENWFSCLDVCYKRKYILSGDCYGNGFLLNVEGDMVWSTRRKLHCCKITHCEFSQNDPNIFVTASVDRTVKLWDMRMVAESKMKPDPVRNFQHLKPVNAAYFSSNGLRLLTTDQHSELRVYSSPCWDELLTIKHPHRQFQHITSVKATWHPLKDIITVGRYPDDTVFPNDARTIDFYDAANGELMHRINSPSGNIVSLNAFNSLGDVLASAGGINVMFLKDTTFNISESLQKRRRGETTENIYSLPKPRPTTRSVPQNKNDTSKTNSNQFYK